MIGFLGKFISIAMMVACFITFLAYGSKCNILGAMFSLFLMVFFLLAHNSLRKTSRR